MTDIAITWPKSKPLEAYLHALREAEEQGLVINYRIHQPPRLEGLRPRCYVVHDGAVRGWNLMLSVAWRKEGCVRDPETGRFWPEGWYLVRDPHWNEIEPIPMKGFRGFRYVDLRTD